MADPPHLHFTWRLCALLTDKTRPKEADRTRVCGLCPETYIHFPAGPAPSSGRLRGQVPDRAEAPYYLYSVWFQTWSFCNLSNGLFGELDSRPRKSDQY